MKSFSKTAFRLYDRVFPYLKNIRGTTRLHRKLLKNWLDGKEIKFEENYCSTDYRGTEILAKSFSDLEDIYRENLIDSYLYGHDLETDDRILVAGAYPGAFVTYLSKNLPKGEIIAVEPDEHNRKRLEKNLDLNNIENVEIVEKPIYSTETTINFSEKGNHASRISEDAKEEKKTTTIDKLAEIYGGFDLITMDIEGAEVEAIKGAEKAVNNLNTHFAVRSYHIVEGKTSSDFLESFAKSKNRDAKTVNNYPIEKTTYF